MTDQPEECRRCGARTHFITLSDTLQEHTCPSCGYKYLLEEEEEIKWEKIPKYGDLFTIEEFIENVECGGFTNDDGKGNYAMKDKMSNICVTPSEIIDGEIDKRFTHVVWFNK
jgi:DNA-directed RNA polymerase subunit RPC12/RpoP